MTTATELPPGTIVCPRCNGRKSETSAFFGPRIQETCRRCNGAGRITELTDPRADFMATIIASPDDDAPRLVCADWLEENGEAERAEFIRVQCELANHEKTCGQAKLARTVRKEWLPTFTQGPCDRCETLRRRERELLLSRREEWFPLWETLWIPLEQNWRGMEEPAEFRRGFIESITCTWSDWLSHSAAILAACPLRKVRLTTWPNSTNVRGEWYYFDADPTSTIHIEVP